MKKFIVYIVVLAVFTTRLSAADLDSCVVKGGNPLWDFVNINKTKINYQLIKDNFPLPEPKIVNASIFGYDQALPKLVRESGDPTASAKALYSASSMGRLSTAAALIGAGVSPNAEIENGLTPLYGAVQFGCSSEVQYLVSMGANLNIRANVKFTLLEMAVAGRYFDTAKVLIDLGYRSDRSEKMKIRAILDKQGNSKNYKLIFTKPSTGND